VTETTGPPRPGDVRLADDGATRIVILTVVDGLALDVLDAGGRVLQWPGEGDDEWSTP
jgi:hypothetical protein